MMMASCALLKNKTSDLDNDSSCPDEFSANPEIRSRITDVTDVTITPCVESIYIRPLSMLYKQDGRHKRWDFIKVHDSVSIIIYNYSKDAMVFVKQFRPGEKSHIDVSQYPISSGVTYEICAGIVDKDLPLHVIAKEEVLEETGFSVDPDQLERVTSMRSGVGVSGALQTIFYLQVTDDQRASRGGGCQKEGELIEVVEVPAERVRTMLYDEKLARPAGFLFCLMWFFTNKYPKIMEARQK